MTSNQAEEQKIAETLVRAQLITIDQLKKAVEFRDSLGGGSIRDLVVKLGYAKEVDIAAALAAENQAPAKKVGGPVVLDFETMKTLPRKIFETHNVVLIKGGGDALQLAMADVNNLAAIEEVQFLTNRTVEPVSAPETNITQALAAYIRLIEEQEANPETPVDVPDQEEIMKFSGDQLMKAYVLCMIQKGQVSKEEILEHARKVAGE